VELWRARQRFTTPIEISNKPRSRLRGGRIMAALIGASTLKGIRLRAAAGGLLN
jgi:hypothetical protein